MFGAGVKVARFPKPKYGGFLDPEMGVQWS